MEELKKYLKPSIEVYAIVDNVFTDSSDGDYTDDPYGEGNKWWT